MNVNRNLKALTFSIALLGVMSGSAMAGLVSHVTSAAGGATSSVGSAVKSVTSSAGSTVKSVTSGGVASGVGSAVGGVRSALGSTVGGVTSTLGSTVGGLTSAAGASLASVKLNVGSASGLAVGRVDVANAINVKLNVMSDQQLLRLCLAVGGSGCGGMNRTELTRFIHVYEGRARNKTLVGLCVSVGVCSSSPLPTNPIPVKLKRFTLLHRLPTNNLLANNPDDGDGEVGDTSDNDQTDKILASCPASHWDGETRSCTRSH